MKEISKGSKEISMVVVLLLILQVYSCMAQLPETADFQVGTEGQLRNAVSSATAGQSIEITSGSIVLSQELRIERKQGLLLFSRGGAVLNGQGGPFAAIRVQTCVDFQLVGVGVQNFERGGVVVFNTSGVELRQVEVTQVGAAAAPQDAATLFAGVEVTGSAAVRLENVTVFSCQTPFTSAAISLSESTVEIANVASYDNTASWAASGVLISRSEVTGGGLLVRDSTAAVAGGLFISGSTVDLTDVTILDNHAATSGGAEFHDSKVTLRNVMMDGNQCESGFGAAFHAFHSDVHIKTGTFFGNRNHILPHPDVIDNGHAIFAEGPPVYTGPHELMPGVTCNTQGRVVINGSIAANTTCDPTIFTPITNTLVLENTVVEQDGADTQSIGALIGTKHLVHFVSLNSRFEASHALSLEEHGTGDLSDSRNSIAGQITCDGTIQGTDNYEFGFGVCGQVECACGLNLPDDGLGSNCENGFICGGSGACVAHSSECLSYPHNGCAVHTPKLCCGICSVDAPCAPCNGTSLPDGSGNSGDDGDVVIEDEDGNPVVIISGLPPNTTVIVGPGNAPTDDVTPVSPVIDVVIDGSDGDIPADITIAVDSDLDVENFCLAVYLPAEQKWECVDECLKDEPVGVNGTRLVGRLLSGRTPHFTNFAILLAGSGCDTDDQDVRLMSIIAAAVVSGLAILFIITVLYVPSCYRIFGGEENYRVNQLRQKMQKRKSSSMDAGVELQEV